MLLTTTIIRFIDRIFRRYLHYHFVGKKIIDEITDGKSPSVNLLSVIFYSSVSPLVIKNILLLMNLLKNNEQKNISFHR